MFDPSRPASRRALFQTLGGAAALAATVNLAPARAAQAMPAAASIGGGRLVALGRQLAAAPRRRGFASVPFMIDRADLWDNEAAAALLSYGGGPRQVWENTEIAAPWLNLMREAVNGQVFAHGHPDFVAVAAVHGTAHLALFTQPMWDKYDLAASTGGKFARNELAVEKPGVSPSDDRQNVSGFYGPTNNNIISLQRRGVVFVACHDSVHAIARGLAAKAGAASADPDLIAADLTNNLVQGAVLVPSVVAFLVELQHAGYTYAKGA
jgi:intracellular sulfur oxidation DsrE/DsrF family protein